MTKEELKKLLAETSKQATAEAKEKNLSKEDTKKYIEEAIAKVKAENQDGRITIHKVDGKIRKQKY